MKHNVSTLKKASASTLALAPIAPAWATGATAPQDETLAVGQAGVCVVDTDGQRAQHTNREHGFHYQRPSPAHPNTGGTMRTRRRFIGLLFAAAVSAVVAFGPASTAHADGSYYEPRNQGSNKCLDVRSEDNYYLDHARVQQYHCTGASEQKWALRFQGDFGNGPVYLLQSQRSGKCMEVQNDSVLTGAQVDQFTCNFSNSQFWRFMNVDIPSRTYVLRNSYSGKCLDLAGGSTADGARIQLWDCNGTSSQKWNF